MDIKYWKMWLNTLILLVSGVSLVSSGKDDSWLDSVLGKSKFGVFSPDFEEENNTVTTLKNGDGTVLDCKVYMLKDKTVSWHRRTELGAELLTVGEITYTGVPRIVGVPTYPNNWRLNISDVRSTDSGAYLCQISTHPPTVLLKNIIVEDAILEVLGDIQNTNNPVNGMEDKFYNPGSDIQLSCVIRRIPGAPVSLLTNIVWRKEGEAIDLHNRQSVSVGTQVESERIISTLQVKHAVLSDSGRYTCSLPHLADTVFPRASVVVHIIQGDHLAYGFGPPQASWNLRLTVVTLLLPTVFY